jgi:Meckel syndrome type 1 protein
MSDTPPNDPKTPSPGPSQGASSEPFVRGRIVWGRPPETVFRAGPLPRPPQSWTQPMRPQPPRPAAPPRPAGDIFTGSMIPRAAPETAFDIPPVVEPEPVAEPPPTEDAVAKPRRSRKATTAKAARVAEPAADASVVQEAPAAEPEPPVVEAYVEPEPEAPAEPILETIVEPEPVRPAARPAPAVEIIVEPEAPEQIDTMPPPLSTAQGQTADPRAIPSVVVTPTLYAQVGAVIEKVKTNDTWRIAAVVGAVAVIAGFVWVATLPVGDAPVLDMDAPPPAAPGAEAPLVVEAAPVPTSDIAAAPPATAAASAPPVVERARPAPIAPSAPPTRPAATTDGPTTAPAPTPRTVAPPVAEPVTPPVIDTAPLVVEPPTAATPAPTDPDAPIATRPQPLN